MYLKAVVMIIFVTGLGAGMLSLRQQRWEAKHSITRMHQQIEQSRRSTWESQVKVAAELQPDKLEHRIMISKMEMEPITATNDPALQRLRVVGDRIPLKSTPSRTTTRQRSTTRATTPTRSSSARTTPSRTTTPTRRSGN